MRSVVLASADAGLRQKLCLDLIAMRWSVREAVGAADAMAQVDQARPEALLVDSWLPDLEAGEFATQMISLYPGMEVLRLDGSTDSDMRVGKSPRRNELLHILRMVNGHRSGEGHTLRSEIRHPEARHPSAGALPVDRMRTDPLPGMIGQSALMLELARMVRLVAPRSTTVLIEGETGTGKEIVARAVHQLSARSTKAFAVLNCAAIPEALLEAELFGHTRGAFTGAVQSRTGRIEAADGGTLFLDEIGEMPLALQAKMLRFLEGGELQRVGDNETLRVDVRVIAATHQRLEQRAVAGTFRLDLYHRLAVFPIAMPALRERLDDLPLLVDHFLQRLSLDMPRKTMAASAMQKLLEHSWPGNVRELKHVLERAAILSGPSSEIRGEDTQWGRRHADKL